jgi:SAM-dependent methyltransferase
MKIERNADVITGSQDLEHLYTFPNFPVFMGCTNAPQSSDTVADMSFWISRSSGMIQLNPLLPLEVLYPEAHGAGCVGASWAAHHQALADFIGKFNPSSVLEIGGAHGILATNYQAKKKIPWTILEPNPTPVKECEAQIIKGFFDENFVFQGDVDAIVHSHVFEHIYDPALFVKNISDFLSPGKKLIFSVPNMRVMVEKRYTNCLNFEHTVYLSEDYIENLLTRYGFQILDREYFLDDHSIFFAAVRDVSTKPVELPDGLYPNNKKLYLDYVQFHEKLVADINAKMSAAESGKIFLFGAHVQAQYLIGFGLNLEKIELILDNDAKKHGKRLFGTDKLVASPLVLADLDSPMVIVRAGTFTNEVVTQIKQINPTARLVL